MLFEPVLNIYHKYFCVTDMYDLLFVSKAINKMITPILQKSLQEIDDTWYKNILFEEFTEKSDYKGLLYLVSVEANYAAKGAFIAGKKNDRKMVNFILKHQGLNPVENMMKYDVYHDHYACYDPVDLPKTQAFLGAVLGNHFELVKNLVTNYGIREGVRLAAGNNNREILEYLSERWKDKCNYMYVIDLAAKNNHQDIVYEFLSHNHHISEFICAICGAISGSQIDFAKNLIEKCTNYDGTFVFTRKFSKAAVESNDPKMVDFVLNNDTTYIHVMLETAAENNNRKMFDYVLKTAKQRDIEIKKSKMRGCIGSAASNGHLNMIKYIEPIIGEEIEEDFYQDLFRGAVANNNLEMLEYACSKTEPQEIFIKEKILLRVAVTCNHIGMYRWILQNIHKD